MKVNLEILRAYFQSEFLFIKGNITMSKKFEIIYIDPNKLIDYELNNVKHTDDDVILLAKVISQVDFDVPIVTDENHVIIKGHKRKYAAIYNKQKLVPVIIRDDMSEKISGWPVLLIIKFQLIPSGYMRI